MKPETLLLRRIAALPPGLKLPVSRFARELNCSGAVVMAMIEGMLADGSLDRSTLRPPVAAVTAQGAGVVAAPSVPSTGPELFEALIAAGRARGMPIIAVSLAVFDSKSQIYSLRKAARVYDRTVAKAEAFLKAVPPEAVAPPAAGCEGAGPHANAPAPSPDITVASFLGQVDAFCERTGTAPSELGKAAFNHPGYVGMVRRRQTLHPETARQVLAVIARHPQGLCRTARLRAEALSSRSPVSRNKASQVTRAAEATARSEGVEEARMATEVAKSTRRPGETLAEAVRREGDDRERRFREATRLTTLNPLPVRREGEEDIGLVSADRRSRELDELSSPSSLLRRAQRDWPDQCAKVKALAAELGCTLADAWHRVISAGVECMTDPEAI